jgi:hypothetical protein
MPTSKNRVQFHDIGLNPPLRRAIERSAGTDDSKGRQKYLILRILLYYKCLRFEFASLNYTDDSVVK